MVKKRKVAEIPVYCGCLPCFSRYLVHGRTTIAFLWLLVKVDSVQGTIPSSQVSVVRWRFNNLARVPVY